ncbi:MAG: bifunctional 2-C-methyl-D-erythritol 4-phosphate cytidylyltransferase/2-C-methyl-D-erythritol 2,4-cyclodiphosphate synthase [Alphaproteobacteria bacterium]|nr:bifunctional 2-C-methyl-D-erythritol 4-phosphate cytidylyltransferase/2-C-methyl-D-erythritol 2,4-cyclodiphosphate synthase [Alphaproteobacteria bacterium]
MNSTTKHPQNGQTPPCGGVIALIVAGGSSERAGAGTPKPYLEIGGKALLARTVEAFLSHPGIDGVRVVVRREHHGLYRSAMAGYTLFPLVVGGNTRQESVRRGLESLRHVNPARVLVHDAARPLVSHDLISRTLEALETHDAVIPVIHVSDTLRYVSGSDSHTVDRTNLYGVQTPQAFHYDTLLAAHTQLAGESFTDDAALFEKQQKPVHAIAGEAINFKVTFPWDIKRLMNILSLQSDTRTAMGYDVHALRPHSPDTPVAQQVIKICGVNIPHTHYLEGHSDADVGLHALVDALLGTLGEGDIGSHFPPSDMRWKGADSDRFLLHAFELLTKRGGEIIHLDLTVICEHPKITPHREAMRNHIAQMLKLAPDRISVKATTTEKLGFLGRGEGIAAQAVATVKIPAKAVIL